MNLTYHPRQTRPSTLSYRSSSDVRTTNLRTAMSRNSIVVQKWSPLSQSSCSLGYGNLLLELTYSMNPCETAPNLIWQLTSLRTTPMRHTLYSLGTRQRPIHWLPVCGNGVS